jgi:superfamily II DNA/RNA helicase
MGIFEEFQTGNCDIISCTDVASRGLDTTRVRHVINFECPFFVSDYLHRAGRTGRLGTKGHCQVTTFVTFKPDVSLLQKLEYSIRTGRPLEAVDGNLSAQVRMFQDNKYRGR